MRLRNVLLSCVLMVPVCGWAMGGTTQLLVNGSFEEPVIAPTSFTVLPTIPGWTATNGFEVQSNEVLGAGQSTPFGNQYVELNVVGPSTLSQTVATVPGEQYTLSFNLSARPQTGSNSVLVSFTGSPNSTFTANDTGVLNFQQFTETFVATANTSVLSFTPTGQFASPNLGDDLDNVSLTGAATAVAGVPLPTAASAGFCGLLFLGVVSLVRRTLRRV
jgi:hypothetical protein